MKASESVMLRDWIEVEFKGKQPEGRRTEGSLEKVYLCTFEGRQHVVSTEAKAEAWLKAAYGCGCRLAGYEEFEVDPEYKEEE